RFRVRGQAPCRQRPHPARRHRTASPCAGAAARAADPLARRRPGRGALVRRANTAAGLAHRPMDPLLHLADLAQRQDASQALAFLTARPELIARISRGEFLIGTAVIAAAAQSGDGVSAQVVDLVTQLSAQIGLPETSAMPPHGADYLDAL